MKKRNFCYVLCILLFFLISSSKTYANPEALKNNIKISAGNIVSNDSNGYVTLTKFSGEISDGEWINHLEYDGTENRGSSRLTFKVDKNFISDDDNYYDIEIEYFDAGIGVILLQSSTDESNSINYPETGYGGYVEEEFWTWSDAYYYANISVNLTNTREWKTHNFRVTDEFFVDNVDNYIHFYFGRTQNFNETLRMKSMTLTKRIFKIDSIDENSANNKPLTGNIYTSDDFGMGFKVYNTSDENQIVTVSYKILDSEERLCYEESFEETTIHGNENKKFYINEPEAYGTYILLVNVVNSDGTVEEEKIEFSKIVSDLSDKINDFIGINNLYGYGAFTTEEQIEDITIAGMKLGIDETRTGINAGFVRDDKVSDYQNELGRYEYIGDIVYDTYKQKILFSVHPYIYSNFEETLAGIIDIYEAIARKYGSKIEYYEILSEVNLKEELSAEQYAEIIVKTSMAIKAIDSDAKIVSVESNRVPIYANDDYSEYSLEDSWIGRVLKTKVCIDDENDVYISPIEILDVISVHPYGDEFTTSPESYATTKPVVSQLKELRDFIEEYRTLYNVEKEIPIWITEVGFQTSVYGGATEEQQAAYFSRMLIWSLANRGSEKANIERVYIYTLQDTGFSNTHPECNYGILNGFKPTNLKGYTRDVEMSTKKAYVAINNYSYLLNGVEVTNSNEQTSESDGYYWYEFENKDGQKIITIWNNDETIESQRISLNIPTGNVDVYDMYGNSINTFENVSENAEFEVSYTPIYIVIDEYVIPTPTYTIEVSASPVEGGTVTGGNTYEENAQVSVEATANDGYTFVNWIENGSTVSTNATYEFLATADRILVAVFEEEQPTTITTISVGNVDLPEVGESSDDLTNNPTTLTYGDSYQMSGFGIKVKNGESWNDYNGEGNLVEVGKTYRIEITLMATSEKLFDSGITDANITVNGDAGKLVEFYDNYQIAKISKEFSYTAPATYTVTFESNGGSAVAAITNVTSGATIAKPTAPTRAGYTFDGWYKESELTNEFNFATDTITGDTTLFAKWNKKQTTGGGGGGGSTTTKYTITVKQNDNGKISPETTKVEKGDNQKFEIKADKGYEVEKVLVDGKSVGAVTEYTFEKVKEKHMIEDTFKKIKEVTEETWKNPFTDVTENDWFYESVKYANENKLFKGVSSTEFGPNVSMTRAMLVTVLCKLEGEPVTNKSIPFADVDMSMYYANAVIWAKQNNIVSGVDETNFAPNLELTREQLVTILYRYAQYKGKDVSAGENTNILSYDDFSELSEYAIPAMQWACGSGIIAGRTTSTIAPKGTATRAEVATILMRFSK